MIMPPNPRVYSQQTVSVIVAGLPMDGFMDGTSVTVSYKGGEVDVTEGTDGPGLNMASRQGGSIKFTLRENSRSFAYLNALRLMYEGLPVATGVAVVTTGTRDIITLGNFLINRPGDRVTGDKKMAGVEFELIGITLFEVDTVV